MYVFVDPLLQVGKFIDSIGSTNRSTVAVELVRAAEYCRTFQTAGYHRYPVSQFGDEFWLNYGTVVTPVIWWLAGLGTDMAFRVAAGFPVTFGDPHF